MHEKICIINYKQDNHPTFGRCQDSLNLVNLAKVISAKIP